MFKPQRVVGMVNRRPSKAYTRNAWAAGFAALLLLLLVTIMPGRGPAVAKQHGAQLLSRQRGGLGPGSTAACSSGGGGGERGGLGAWPCSEPALPAEDEADKKVLTMYFPQFHAFPVNDRLWGEGFTDWVNVAKLTRGEHGQPILRPSEINGFYNLTDPLVRAHQAELAKAYGVHGFMLMHYWFDGGPIMERPLELMLEDGEPDIPFCLMWANEPWTKNWDGSEHEMLVEQTYKDEDMEPHWQWFLKFFQHHNHIMVDGAPVLNIYRAHGRPPALTKHLEYWTKRAKESGFTGLHILQAIGMKHGDANAHALQPAFSGSFEYFPNFCLFNDWAEANREYFPTWASCIAKRNTTEVYYRGVTTWWDNSPRRPPGLWLHQNMHPSVFAYVLRQQLAQTAPGGFVFVNAWNEWGEGAVLEPSVQFGRRFLQAVKQAVAGERRGAPRAMLNEEGLPLSVPLPPAGVSTGSDGEAGGGGGGKGAAVCFGIYTRAEHAQGLYNIRQLLSSLQTLHNGRWTAQIVSVGSSAWLTQLVEPLEDDRLHVLELAPTLDLHKAVDSLAHACSKANPDAWFLPTDGLTLYTPDALDVLPEEEDLLLMNAYSWTATVRDIEATKYHPTDFCCIRFNDLRCTAAAPKVHFALGGAILYRLKRWKAEERSFAKLAGCHDFDCHGLLAEQLVEDGWSYATHPLDVCAFHQNPNPMSCELVGGVYYDTTDQSKVGCYDVAALPPLPEGTAMNWENFISSRAACMCGRTV